MPYISHVLTNREINENIRFLKMQWEAAQQAKNDRTYLRATHMGLSSRTDDPMLFLAISRAEQHCEKCDARRMASCAIPHCHFRRQHLDYS